MKYQILNTLLLVLFAQSAFANRLEEAAGRGVNDLLAIGKVAAPIGIIVGGLMMALGWIGIGKMVAVGGIVGAVAIFGAPAFVEFVQGLFT